MKKGGPVIIIEDDFDDQELLREIFKRLNYGNELIFFSDGEQALDFLYSTTVKPFIILSDINIPRIDGMALRERINSDDQLKFKCIPYLFYSTAANPNQVFTAYSLSVQGFFQKGYSFTELEKTISIIMQYWERCVAPNKVT
ncbi:MAG: response regulator [Ferruginibacter sp.]|nr:response regulator [Ferruginibacter sp.]